MAGEFLSHIKCRIRTSLEDLVAYLATLQPLPGLAPLVLSRETKLYVPVQLGWGEVCLLEAEAGEGAFRKYLVVLVKGDAIKFSFEDKLPGTMEAKTYPIIHVVEA